MNITQGCECCQGLVRSWEKKLTRTGFEDIEKTKPLKQGTRIEITHNNASASSSISNIMDLFHVQEPNQPMKTTWVDIQIKEFVFEDQDIKKICKSLGEHGGCVVSPNQMVKIWYAHRDGEAFRSIGQRMNIHYATVFRVIKKIKEFLTLMPDDGPFP